MKKNDKMRQHGDVTQRVKTFEDAARELGKDNPLVAEYEAVCEACGGRISTDLLAYLKLRIITAALNEGWVPQFIVANEKFYPWFFENLEEDWLTEIGKKNVVPYPHSPVFGYVVVDAYNDYYDSYNSHGTRLLFKTRELARYAGRQFIDLWADFAFKSADEAKD